MGYMTLMTPSHMSLRYVDSGQRAKWMSYGIGADSVAGGEGEEEAGNLRAVDTVHNVFDSFAKQPCYERGHKRESAEGSPEAR